ncbi:MAG: septation protein A [Desulfobulbus sp.]|nr:septation protein A [Desulfobulbus sp.]
MKLLFDIFPVILFFGAFKYGEKQPERAAEWLAALLGATAVSPQQAPVLLATVVVIAATVIQVAWVHFRHGKVDKMLWMSLGIVVIFGGLTLAFRNDAFIKWKPTILYWAFAVSLAFSSLVMKKNAIRGMLGEQISLPETAWNRLNLAWIGFFAVMGVLNLIVAFNFSTDTWVDFKLFGVTGLMLLFILAQGMLLAKYVEEEK